MLPLFFLNDSYSISRLGHDKLMVMNEAQTMSLFDFRFKNIIIYELFCAFCPELKHDTHTTICIYIRILAAKITTSRWRKEDVFIGIHEFISCIATFFMFLSIENILLCEFVVSLFHKNEFYDILYFFYANNFRFVFQFNRYLQYCLIYGFFGNRCRRIFISSFNSFINLL